MKIYFYHDITVSEAEATSVLCVGDSKLIKGITCHEDNSITVHCSPKLERLDKMSDGTIWMLDKEMVKLNPEPYKSIDTDKSETIWTKPQEVKA